MGKSLDGRSWHAISGQLGRQRKSRGGLRIRRRPPQSVQHGCCVCFRRYILNNKAAHIAERAMCAASHKQARGDVGESKKNRSIQIGCFDCLLLPKKIHPGKPCGSMDSGFCATCIFVFLRFFQAISEPPYDILTKPCANRGEKRAVRQHSPLSYFSLMICSYSMAYLFSITILL